MDPVLMEYLALLSPSASMRFLRPFEWFLKFIMNHFFKLFSYCLLFQVVVLKSNEVRSNFGKGLWLLRCSHYSFEICQTLTKDDLKNDHRFDRLESMMESLPGQIEHLYMDNMSNIIESDLCSVPQPVLLVTSMRTLSNLNGELLGKLLRCNIDSAAVVRFLAQTAQGLNTTESFYEELQHQKPLSVELLRIIAEEVQSLSSQTSLQIFVSDVNSILEFLDPKIIITNPQKMLSYLRNVPPSDWYTRPIDVKRLWAFVLVESEHPINLSLWDDELVRKMGHLLVGATVRELEGLNNKKILHPEHFFSMGLSKFQIQGLFNHLYGGSTLHQAEYTLLEPHLSKLLPKNLLNFSPGLINFSRLRDWGTEFSLPTARQFVQILTNGSLSEYVSNPDNLIRLNQLVFSVPLRFLKRFVDHKFYLGGLLGIQHKLLSAHQIFYLTKKGSVLNFTYDDMVDANELLKGLPTSAFNSVSVSPALFARLLSNMPGNMPPRNAALLDNIWPQILHPTFLPHLARNKDFYNFLELLPSKYFERNVHTFSHNMTFEQLRVLSRFPDRILSILLKNITEGKVTVENSSRTIISQALLNGMSCEEIQNIPSIDFISVMSKYNQLRRYSGKFFPKDLQNCCLTKLADYLRLKSAFVLHYMGESLLHLLSRADIEGVGGFLLAGIPVEDLRFASYKHLIIKTVGKLSMPELLEAASLRALMDLTELRAYELGLDVVHLGNLTTFMSVPQINSIDGPAFKLMLEMGYLDGRVCVASTQRKALANLVVRAFNIPTTWTGQDLVALGDLLLVLPYSALLNVPRNAWVEAAEFLKTKYFDEIPWKGDVSPFHLACEQSLPDEVEADLYRRELRLYVSWVVSAAQSLIETVAEAHALQAGVQRIEIPKRPWLTASSLYPNPSGNKCCSSTLCHLLNVCSPFSWGSRDKAGLKSYSLEHAASMLAKTFRRKRSEPEQLFSCDAIRMVGRPAQIFLRKPEIDRVSRDDIKDCIGEFGQMELRPDVRQEIWRKAEEETDLHLAGKLLDAADVSDLISYNISLDAPWALETLHYISEYNSKNETRFFVAAKLESHPKEFSFAQVIALGSLICQIKNIKSRISPKVFFKASRYLGAHLPCHHQCIQEFSSFLESAESYGPTDSWTSEDVESLGLFVTGLNLEKWTKLITSKPKVVSNLNTKVLKCLRVEHVKALTVEAIQAMRPSTVAFLLDSFTILNTTVKNAADSLLKLKINYETPNVHVGPFPSHNLPNSSQGFFSLSPLLFFVSLLSFLC